MLGEDITFIESLENGKIPKSWKPKETNTLEEVTLLSSLDIVSARGRAKKLFDFDYKWEVYVPAHKRRWGYYVLPILYGDDLVARLDPKLERNTMTLDIRGFWHEDDAPDVMICIFNGNYHTIPIFLMNVWKHETIT